MQKRLGIYLIALFLLVVSVFAISPVLGANDINRQTCTYKEHKLYGKVQIVESFPDIKIKVTSSFPDLQVQLVDSFPDNCGQWQFVESFPDLKVQFVSSFPGLR